MTTSSSRRRHTGRPDSSAARRATPPPPAASTGSTPTMIGRPTPPTQRPVAPTPSNSSGSKPRPAGQGNQDYQGASPATPTPLRDLLAQAFPRAVPPPPPAHDGAHAGVVAAAGAASLTPQQAATAPAHGDTGLAKAERAAERAAEVCPLCAGLGWVRSAAAPGAPTFGQAVPCVCMRSALSQREQRRIERASQLTDSLRRVTFERLAEEAMRGRLDAEAREALAHLREFAEDAEQTRGWVVLDGRTGTNKTRLLAATANALLARGVSALYVVTPDFLDTVRAAYETPGAGDERATRIDSAEQLIQAAINAEVLLLDDLGAEAETAWVNEKLYRIINARYNAEAPLIVATNTPLRQMEPRIRSRLSDVRLTMRFVLSGPDLRPMAPITPITPNLPTAFPAALPRETRDPRDPRDPWDRGRDH